MSDADLVTEVAELYYMDRLTQDDLAKRFGTSRSTISRLLKQAHDTGIVEIHVRARPDRAQKIEQELQARFGLSRLLCAVDLFDPANRRMNVAALVAAYLDKVLVDGKVVAVGMGRNVSAIAEAPGQPLPRDVLFVSAIGGSVQSGEMVNADHIARRLAARFHGRSETLYAPAIVEDETLRLALLRNDNVRRTLDHARGASIALLGVGDMTEDSNMIRMDWLSPRDVARAQATGTVGDILGNDFLDIQGRPSRTIVAGRVVGLTLKDLEAIEDVVVVASENTKAAILLGVLRTGVMDTLVTTLSNAQAVLDLDETTSGDS
jgi:DNA-binding transcriptional regulator LsrR (DeoR family)